ncbi:MAG: asparagine synthase (glutamine-hydrolyzing) [Crocinitomicaceae bacterium]
MCGIAGILSKSNPVQIRELKKMTDIIHHRGPDGDGHWINEMGNVGFGHRRLSIIDLSNYASQPMHFGNGRFTITFNGEIYNYLEIRQDLLQKGYTFSSNSDTEVLLALYAQKGAACLEELDGMFAFAIWDDLEKVLFCARDRFGEKPFHYAFSNDGKFVFGSEIKQLFEVGISRKCNQKILFNFFESNHVLHDPRNPQETFYQEVYRLEPAYYMIVTPDLNVVKKRYWDLNMDSENKEISLQDAADKFYELMLQSVKLRLRSDVPVGSSLSGGLDSSTIVCLIDKLNANQTIAQKTFSARFKNFERDEGKFMQMVIDSTNVEPHFTFPDEQKFVSDFKKVCWHQEEPFSGPSVFAQWEVMKLAKQNNVTVLLDGQGADESLAGYHYFFHTYLNELKRNQSSLYERELNAYRSRHNPNYGLEQSISSAKQHSFEEKLKDLIRPIYRTFNPIKQEAPSGHVPDFLNQEFTSQFESEEKLPEHTGGLKEQLYVNNCVIGLNNLLRFADRNSMAFSREMRLPFLSHQLVEFLFSLPNEFKIYDGWTKYVMRKAFEPILPNEITWRVDKIGYEPPQSRWMENKDIIDLIQNSIVELEKEGIVNKKRKVTGKDDKWNSLVVNETLLINN